MAGALVFHFTPPASVFFFNDTATTEIYTLSLHDALPIWSVSTACRRSAPSSVPRIPAPSARPARSEEHTSELQSRLHLVCRLLLEKKKTTYPSGTRARAHCIQATTRAPHPR